MAGKIIYPGTFDPITNGHIDLINRIAVLFDEVIVAVAANTRKSPLFSLDKRIELVKTVLNSDKVKVCGFEGLLIDFAKKQKSKIIARGLRAVSDFEYEFQLAAMNRHMDSEIETLFMVPSEQYAFLSANLFILW
jgi:pantetheine-phosphate adenylyltransferase